MRYDLLGWERTDPAYVDGSVTAHDMRRSKLKENLIVFLGITLTAAPKLTTRQLKINNKTRSKALRLRLGLLDLKIRDRELFLILIFRIQEKPGAAICAANRGAIARECEERYVNFSASRGRFGF